MKAKHFILTLLALFVSITVSAEEWTDANGTIWSFTTSEGNATLYKGYNTPCISGTIPADLAVPSKVYISETAYNVTSIGNQAFYNCSSLTSITLPDAVTSIGESAFYGCSSLTSINIPDGVWLINEYTFYGCSSLTSITLPSVTSIYRYAFSGCSSITSINISDNVVYLGEYAFEGCHELSSNIPIGVTSIRDYTFYGCSSLPAITIPDGVTSIGRSAFEGCSSLTSVSLGDDVTSIGACSFYGCSKLTSITIPNGVTSIPSGTFYGCFSLTSITIPDGVTSIGEYAFKNCSGLSSITLPDGVISIGSMAFQDCHSLTSINIPDDITSIGAYAFRDCRSLVSIIIPDGVTSIGTETFAECHSLVSATLGDGIVSIGRSAFSCCYNLRTINIPKDVVFIGEYAFNQCSNLLFLHVAPIVPIEVCPWSDKATIFVPDESVAAYKTAWTDYVNQIVPESKCEYVYDVDVTAQEYSSAVIEAIGESNALYVVNLKVHGTINSYDVMAFRNKMKNLRNLDLSDACVVSSSYVYYSRDAWNSYRTIDNEITGYFGPETIISFKFPKGITAMWANAFSGCVFLQSITLPNGISFIPDNAFDNCVRLTSINIPESIISIGRYAFYNCSKLSNVHLPVQLERIEDNAFYGCQSFTGIHLPPYVTYIGNNEFRDCLKLKDVYAYMPDVISIGSSTFNDYMHQQLYIPEFLYNNYYYDTNWSQFLNVNKTTLSADDYTKLPTNSDIVMGEDDQRIPDMSNGEHVDGEINSQGSFTVEGDEPQEFNNVDQVLNGEGQGGSLIGEDDGETEGNLTVNTLRVKINVKASRWYFFCFPYDVTIANCTYPGQYAWRFYDGAYRALNGSGGWKAVTGSTLTAGVGYAFQSSHTGNLIVEFSHPKFGGDRTKTLVAHASANAANASWNLVGNPYSSFYDFLEDDFDAPITVYNNGTYTAYRPADDECHLQPYEAFFVQKPTEVDAINFEAERRESYRQGETKKTERTKARRRAGITPERRIINLEMFCGDEQADRTRVVLNEQKSRDYELDCDASKFLSNEAVAQLYSIENGVQMAINERPQQGDIRLGYTAAKAGKLSISASRMDMPMVLVDTKENTTFDLSLGSYEFETQAGTFNDRFMLRLSGEATAINNMTKKTGVCIGTQNGGIAIGGAEGKTVNVYTIGGAQAAQHSGNGFVALKHGVYVVNVDGVSAKVSVK